MKSTNYTHELTVAATASVVYQALSRNLGIWWGISNEGVNRIGDTMTVRFEGIKSHWGFQASELVEAKRIVLTCIEDTHIHEGPAGPVLDEWKGSRLVMDITEESGSSRIHFTHEGLTPDLSCYDVCVAGWNHYMGKGLEDYLQRMEPASAENSLHVRTDQ